MKNYVDNDIFYKYLTNTLTGDLHPLVVGFERCDETKKQIGPYISTRFIIHLCVEGNGTLIVQGKKYIIEKNTIFFIPVNTPISYYQNLDNPWTYYWFEYSGQDAIELNKRAGLTANSPIYQPKDTDAYINVMQEMLDATKKEFHEIDIHSLILKFFSMIIDERPSLSTQKTQRRFEFNEIVSYINNNYSIPTLTLKEVSDHFGFNMSYLSTAFKENMSMSFNKYLNEIRMQKAISLLNSESVSIKTIALSVGFTDPLYFSKKFLRRVGVTPTEYKKMNTQEK